MPKMPEKLCRCQASRLLFHRIMDTKENCVFCEYFVLPASGQMGVCPGLWNPQVLWFCAHFSTCFALPGQDLGGSSGIGNVSALAFLQKNGLIYWIVLSVLCSTFQRGTLAHPSWAPRTHRADYF